MDRWKAELGRVREEKRRRKSIKKEKEDPGARKGRKVAKHCVFPMICGCGGSESRPAKAAGAEPSGQMRDEKLHAVVARSTFPSQNVQSTPASDHFWKLGCRKSARRCGAKHVSKSKWTKHTRFGALLEIEIFKKCTLLWHCGAKHISKSKVQKPDGFGAFLDVQMSFRVAGARDYAPGQRWAKRHGFVTFSKNDGRRGTFEEDLQRCIFRGRRSTRDMFVRDVRRSGRWFPERGCIFEHQIFRFAEMILRNRCSTSYDLASLFRGRRSTLDRWSGKIAKRIGTRPSALHSTFHFWRKSRRIVSFLTSSPSKNEEVSQNCFVFDVVKFKNWGSLTELLRFQAYS